MDIWFESTSAVVNAADKLLFAGPTVALASTADDLTVTSVSLQHVYGSLCGTRTHIYIHEGWCEHIGPLSDVKNSLGFHSDVRSSLLERCDSEVLAGNRRARMDATLCA